MKYTPPPRTDLKLPVVLDTFGTIARRSDRSVSGRTKKEKGISLIRYL